MEKWVSDSTARQRFSSFVLGAFAAVATVLAAAGLFGLMSYVVAQRRHEIGIRLALGAPAGTVLSLIVRQGVVLALAGIGVGIPAALGAARLLGSQLYATGPADGPTFAAVSLVLLATGLVACLVPAIRATRIDCVEALKAER
jgi:putative ABC transport system permease protein